jgi:transcriptional regulator with XRE-family HTH domain
MATDLLFSNRLKRYRQVNDFTQLELSQMISAGHSELSGVDTVTISRWERGKTKPSLRKRYLISTLIDDDLDPFFIESKLEASHVDGTELLDAVSKFFNRRESIGFSPYIPKVKFKIQYMKYQGNTGGIDYLSDVVRYMKSVEGREVCGKTLRYILENNIGSLYLCISGGILVGHSLVIELPRELMSEKWNFEITLSSLLEMIGESKVVTDDRVYYIVSNFASTLDVFRVQINNSLKYMVTHAGSIVSDISHEGQLILAKHLGASFHLLDKAKVSENHGISVYGKIYPYVRVILPKSLLATNLDVYNLMTTNDSNKSDFLRIVESSID